MRRRSSDETDALELLLDTVCNAFGGIIFIVLLLVILPTRSSTAPKSIQAQLASAAQLAELKMAEGEIEQVMARIEVQRRAAKSLTRDQDPAEIARRHELERRKAQVEAELQAASVAAEQVDARIEAAKAGVKQLQETRAQVEAGLIDSKKNAANRMETRETRLPRLRSIYGKHNLFIALSGNRVYLVRKPGAYSLSLAENDDDFDIRSIDEGAAYTPKAGAGTAVDAWVQSEEYRRFMRQAPSSEWVINLIVYPDSVGSFAALRNAFAGQGYDHVWYPEGQSNPFILVRTSGPATGL